MVASFHCTGEMDKGMVLACHAHLVLGTLAKIEKCDELTLKKLSNTCNENIRNNKNSDKIDNLSNSTNDKETCVIWSVFELWKRQFAD